jgi:hypothetical protein
MDDTLIEARDDIDVAYFVGEALCTYLNTPFLYTQDGVTTEEIPRFKSRARHGVGLSRCRRHHCAHQASGVRVRSNRRARVMLEIPRFLSAK